MATGWWAWQGREVQLVAAPGGRVQCVSYAPSSRRDEVLVNVGVVVSPERIEQDLKLLAERFDCVRTYSQSNGLAEVPRIARGLGLKVLMGVWISRDPAVNESEIESATRIAERDRDVIRGIIVGNEALTLSGAGSGVAGSSTHGALRNLSGGNFYGGTVLLNAAATINES